MPTEMNRLNEYFSDRVRQQAAYQKLESAKYQAKAKVLNELQNIFPDLSHLNLDVDFVSWSTGWTTMFVTLDYAKRIAFNEFMRKQPGWEFERTDDNRETEAKICDLYIYPYTYTYKRQTHKETIYLTMQWRAQLRGNACIYRQVSERIETKVVPIYEVICQEGAKEMGLVQNAEV